jgi:hypothetical protein
MLYFSILLHCIGAFVPFKCSVVHCTFIGHYMFRPNWASSGVQVKGSAAQCNAGFLSS